MAYFSYTSQASSFLPREEFMSGSSFTESLQDSSPTNQRSTQPSQSPPPLQPHHQPSSSSTPPATSRDEESSVTSEYQRLIERRPIEGIKCIQELINWNNKEREAIIECLFGVVRTVRDSNQTKYKSIVIIDPTSEDDGIEIQTFWTLNKIAVGQMVKICKLKVFKTGSSLEYLFTPATKTSFYPLFSYDYSDPTGSERNKVLTETHFQSKKDRDICYLLEKWYSSMILNRFKLSKLPEKNTFTNLCCQVLAYNKTPLCINAVVWDLTPPKYSPLLGTEGKWPPGFELINHDYFPIAYERYFTITIWREEAREQAQHYDTFKCLDLTNGNDMVVLFNLQVVEDPNHPGLYSLVMRSSRKWGKAVRLCHPKSIIGQMFSKRIEEFRRNFRKKLGLPCFDVEPKFAEPASPQSPSPIESTRIEPVLGDLVRRSHDFDLSSSQAQDSPRMEVGASNYDEDQRSLLSHLKEKGKSFMVWDALLEMGVENLERYSALVQRTDEVLLSMDGNPLTKEERLRFIRFAIDHLSTQVPDLLSNGHHNKSDSEDSLLTNDTFPLIDRVKD